MSPEMTSVLPNSRTVGVPREMRASARGHGPGASFSASLICQGDGWRAMGFISPLTLGQGSGNLTRFRSAERLGADEGAPCIKRQQAAGPRRWYVGCRRGIGLASCPPFLPAL